MDVALEPLNNEVLIHFERRSPDQSVTGRYRCVASWFSGGVSDSTVSDARHAATHRPSSLSPNLRERTSERIAKFERGLLFSNVFWPGGHPFGSCEATKREEIVRSLERMLLTNRSVNYTSKESPPKA